MTRFRSLSAIFALALCACSGATDGAGKDVVSTSPDTTPSRGADQAEPGSETEAATTDTGPGNAETSPEVDPTVTDGTGATAQGGDEESPSATAPDESGFDVLEVPELSEDALVTATESDSMLRLLIKDAPVEAESVMVTFCGIEVQTAAMGADDPSDEDPAAEGTEPSDEGTMDENTSPEETEPSTDDAGGDGMEPADDAAPQEMRFEPEDTSDLETDAAEDADMAAADAGDDDTGVEDATDGETSAEDGNDATDGGGDDAAGGWITASDTCQTFDLLELQNGLTSDFGLADLPPGRYGQIRLDLTEASILVDGTWYELTVPSGAESGIKIGHRFDLSEGSLTTIALDFDADRSVRYTEGAGYMMRPVIEVVAERHESFDAARGRPEDAGSDDAEARGSDAERGKPDDAAAAGADASDTERGQEAGADAETDRGRPDAAGRPEDGEAGNADASDEESESNPTDIAGDEAEGEPATDADEDASGRDNGQSDRERGRQ